MAENIPPVRALEAFPIERGDQQLVILRDPFHYVEETLSVSLPVYLLLTLMDGNRTVADVQQAFQDQFGGKVETQDVENLVRELDENGLLMTERFTEMRDRAHADFRDAPVRQAAHAGSAYPDEDGALREQIDTFYQFDGQDDAPEFIEKTPEDDHRPIRGLVAPHIDPQAGGPCAARAFNTLRAMEGPLPDLFVILGTAHQPAETPFILTEKPFETPLGTVETDTEVASELANRFPLDLKAEEYLHKHEHSVEFQIIFLQHLYQKLAEERGEEAVPEFKILPILVSSFHEFLQTNTLPSTDESVQGFTSALQDILAASGKRVCFLAGADLSHMGRKFGDDHDLDEAYIEETKQWDREMLNHLARGDREGFFRHLQVNEDQQKVCGFPPIYMMLNLMGEEAPGQILDYDMNVEENTQSFVTFTSMAYRDTA